MTARALEKATYADLLRVPDTLIAELIDGELFTSPRPRASHSRAAGVVYARTFGPYDHGIDGPGGWWIFFEPELHLGDDVAIPDLAAWRRERMPEYPSSHVFALAPDWVCEVLSPSTGRLDRGKKLPLYARSGIGYAWVLDPDERYLEVRRLENGRWSVLSTYDGNDKVRAEPFPEAEIDLTLIWGFHAEDDLPLPSP